jgi:hypothetical protein
MRHCLTIYYHNCHRDMTSSEALKAKDLAEGSSISQGGIDLGGSNQSISMEGSASPFSRGSPTSHLMLENNPSPNPSNNRPLTDIEPKDTLIDGAQTAAVDDNETEVLGMSVERRKSIFDKLNGEFTRLIDAYRILRSKRPLKPFRLLKHPREIVHPGRSLPVLSLSYINDQQILHLNFICTIELPCSPSTYLQ